MKYLALYRKYRPNNFDDVCGQTTIVQTLKNIIKYDKVSHSYLFIGPRGTGKTSIAKIFAKTINCENPIDGNSCGECSVCKLKNDENIDIIEMDAASNNGVDEIRNIRDHVALLPTNSKYKIYIIDEVHMLTTGAFNALLKTLEEPPQHVIFILATTEPHKIPLTIKSRCQSYEFKLINKELMIERLKHICDEENIKYEEDAIRMIAESSNGGLRDAISLLDQVNSYTNGNIKSEDVLLLNGHVSIDEISQLFDYINNDNLEDCFKLVDTFENNGKDFLNIVKDMIQFLKSKIIDNNELNLIDSINILNNSINKISNSIDKRLFFDIAIIQLYNILKQTNVRSKNDDNVSTINNEVSKINIKKEEKKSDIINSESKTNNNELIELYDKLMKIRLNNVLKEADKNNLGLYSKLLTESYSSISDLDSLKIINILSTCNIRAGSKDGLVITIDNINLLHEMYSIFNEIEKYINKVISKKITLVILFEDEWFKEREIFISKIKNKEVIEKIDESDIIKEIKKLSNDSEFDDLLDIGE